MASASVSLPLRWDRNSRFFCWLRVKVYLRFTFCKARCWNARRGNAYTHTIHGAETRGCVNVALSRSWPGDIELFNWCGNVLTAIVFVRTIVAVRPSVAFPLAVDASAVVAAKLSRQTGCRRTGLRQLGRFWNTAKTGLHYRRGSRSETEFLRSVNSLLLVFTVRLHTPIIVIDSIILIMSRLTDIIW